MLGLESVPVTPGRYQPGYWNLFRERVPYVYVFVRTPIERRCRAESRVVRSGALDRRRATEQSALAVPTVDQRHARDHEPGPEDHPGVDLLAEHQRPGDDADDGQEVRQQRRPRRTEAA